MQERVDLGTEKSLEHVEFGPRDGQRTWDVVHDLWWFRLASRRASAFSLSGQYGGLVSAEGGSPACGRCSGGGDFSDVLGPATAPDVIRGGRDAREVRAAGGAAGLHPTKHVKSHVDRQASVGQFLYLPRRDTTRPREKAREPPCEAKFRRILTELKKYRSAEIAEAGLSRSARNLRPRRRKRSWPATPSMG